MSLLRSRGNGSSKSFILPPNPVFHFESKDEKSYPGNGNTWYNLGTNNNNISLNNVTFTSDERLLYDGTTSFGSLNVAGVDWSTEQTIVLVLEPNESDGNRRNPYNQAYGGYGTITHETGDYFNYYHGTAGTNTSPYQGTNSNTTIGKVLKDETKMIVVTRNEHGVNWYINGELVRRVDNQYPVAESSVDTVLIGDGYTNHYSGYIDFYLSYTRAISPIEIENIYNYLVDKKYLPQEKIKKNFEEIPVASENLLLYIDPDNDLSVSSGATEGRNLVSLGLLTGASGTPGTGDPIIEPNNFPPLKTEYGHQVFDFDGTHGINVNEDLGQHSEISLSLWFYKTSSSTRYFFDARNNGGSWWLSNYQSHNINFHSRYEYNFDGSYDASNDNFLNQWHHLVAVSDSSGSEVYLNGEKLANPDTSNSLNESLGKNFRIGMRYTSSGQWIGYMGPIYAFNRKLTPFEIKKLFELNKYRFSL